MTTRPLCTAVLSLGGLVLYGAVLSPVAAQTWVSAWGGRGPLSTTITTTSTFKDAVPSLSGRTLRVMTHLTTGGSQVKVRLSQRFSSSPLAVAAAHVGIRSVANGTGIVTGSDRTLTFHGASSVTVPAGGDVWSDPVSLTVTTGKDLAISIYVPGSFTPTTEGGRAQIKSSYYLQGNQVSSVSFPFAQSTHQVFVAYEVQVLAPGRAATIVALGDSITEGACSSVDANGDWPDLLAARVPALADGTAVAMFNAGIGSGRFASSDGAGLRGLTRLDELLTLPNVRAVMLLMGVNDISYEHVTAAFLENAFAQAILKAHAAGAKIVGVPILPFGHSTKDVGTNKQVAQAVNAWIRAHDARLGAAEPSYDAIVDFEPAIKDPADPAWALSRGLTCDGVHPNQAGYSAIAKSIPTDVFN